uniref:Cysteine-rich transmembrane domain-containing protein n=1 Tax=Kalanchoe fedtschenkoi TaxID=63787 RepID=A0A7N0TKA3_KALFE
MSQKQPQMAYPYPGPVVGTYDAPPPAGYPTRNQDALPQSHHPLPIETKSRGDGFWKGCCAALCCCCVLDACF